MIKLQCIASIWRQNDKKFSVTSQNIQKNAKLQNWSNYNELLLFDVKMIKTTQNYKLDQITINLHRFDLKTIQNVEIRRKTFKTTQNYESDQIIVHCIDLTSKRSKLLSYVAKLQNDPIIVHWIDLTSKRFKTFVLRPKTTKVIKLQK